MPSGAIQSSNTKLNRDPSSGAAVVPSPVKRMRLSDDANHVRSDSAAPERTTEQRAASGKDDVEADDDEEDDRRSFLSDWEWSDSTNASEQEDGGRPRRVASESAARSSSAAEGAGLTAEAGGHRLRVTPARVVAVVDEQERLERRKAAMLRRQNMLAARVVVVDGSAIVECPGALPVKSAQHLVQQYKDQHAEGKLPHCTLFAGFPV